MALPKSLTRNLDSNTSYICSPPGHGPVTFEWSFDCHEFLTDEKQWTYNLRLSLTLEEATDLLRKVQQAIDASR
jgi:hypothetical protein